MKNLKKPMSIPALIMALSVMGFSVSAQSTEMTTEAETKMHMAEGHAAEMGEKAEDQMGMMKNMGEGHKMGDGEGGMPMMKMMEERHEMMKAHMTKMETSLSNIEALLKELVELQKNSN